ncbi:PAS domain S-box protein [Methanoculleus sp.]|uniref:PAS domain S-box protein n=1 Tax=Methanoculleus sp. TaxID=90427 RepID=UPI0026005865|nr:PAS domain S-box protein [Methanoculleus sp.]
MTPSKPPEHLYGTPPEYRIFEGMDDGILVVGEDSSVVWANPAFRRIPGNATEIVPDLHGRLSSASGDRIEEFECRFIRPDERERRYHCSGRRPAPGENWVFRFREVADEKRDYEAIVEYTGTATILIEGDGTISLVNTEFERLSGYARSDIIGKKQLSSFIASEDDRRRIMGYHILRRRDPAAAPQNYSFTFIDRSGTTHTVETTIGLIPGTARSVMSLLDVTERRRAEQALQESEERLNLALSAANDGLVDWDVRSGTIVYGPRSFSMLGYEPGAFVPTIPTILALIHPEDRGHVEAVLADLATGERDHAEMEFRMRSASGTWVYVLDRLRVVGRDESGIPIRIAGTHSDITGRKEAEEQLRFQAQVLAQVEDAVIAVDAEGRITYTNRAAERLYGAPPDGDSGRPGSELFTREWLRPEDEEEMQSALQSSGTWQGIVRHRRWDGETILVDETLSTLNDDSGRITGTLCSLRDVTAQKRAEQELRIKDMAIASSLDAICLTDLDGRIIYANRAFLSMHGWEREEEILGQPATVLWADPEEAERVVEAFHRDGTWLGEVEGRRRDGSTFPMQLALSSVTDETGKPLCRMGSGIDITRRKEAERDLRIKDMAIASSPSAFTIADLDGRHIYVNQAFLSLWGYDSPSEVIGRPITEFWQDGQIITSSGRYTGERIGKRRDGSTFCAIFSGNVVTDDTGAPIGRAASLTDITSIKRAEREIQAHNRALSVLNQIIGVSASTTDIDEMLESVLAATLALLDLAGGGIYLIEPGRLRARLVCADGLPEGFPVQSCIPDITAPPYADVLVAGKPRFFDDHPHLRHPGESGGRPHPYASVPIMAHGKVVGALNVVPRNGSRFTQPDRSLLIAIGREIGTSVERTMLIRQLEVAEREANLYLDILGHDIRNAENVSGLYTDLLLETLEGEAKGYARKLQASIRKSIEILRNVSTIRRIHQESAVLVPVDLDRVIREEIGMFPEIRFCYGGTDLTVTADALLSEVFTNLIGNAIKFGGPAVEVTIRVEEHGDEVRVSVEDTGPGVPDVMKEAVFMRFGQSRSRKSGQGLGLYITRMLVERYGGRVRVDDRIPGRPECGAAFRFTLKRA